MKRRVGTTRGKPSKALEERLARMEMLLELSNSGNDSVRSAVSPQQLESSSFTKAAEMHNTESQSLFPASMTNDAIGLLDGTDIARTDSPSDRPSSHSQMTQKTSYTLLPLPPSTLTQPQHSTHHMSPQDVQTSSLHIECADLLGTEVCRPPLKRSFHCQCFMEIKF